METINKLCARHESKSRWYTMLPLKERKILINKVEDSREEVRQSMTTWNLFFRKISRCDDTHNEKRTKRLTN